MYLPALPLQNQGSHIPKIALIVLAAVLPISTSFSHVILVLVLVSFCLCLGSTGRQLRHSLQHPVSQWALLLFICYIIGTVYSVAPWQDLFKQLEKMSKLLYMPLIIALMTEAKWRKPVLLTFVSAMAGLLILSLGKMYGGLSIASRYTEAALFKSHIDTNLMMTLALFFTAHWTLDNTFPKLRPVFYVLLPGFTFYVLWMSEGRTGYIIFIALWVLFWLQRFSLKYLIPGLLCLGLLIGGASLGSPQFQKRVDQLYQSMVLKNNDKDPSFGQRYQFLIGSTRLALKHPWLGWGTGSFNTVYGKYAEEQDLYPSSNPHNEYANVLFQLGGLGLLVLLGLFFTIFRCSFFLPLYERYCVQGVLAAMMVGCLGNSWLMDMTPGYLFVLLSAACLGAFPLQEKKREKKIVYAEGLQP